MPRQRLCHFGNVDSRQIAVVKQRWAWLVLGWVTAFKAAQINHVRSGYICVCGGRPDVLYSTNTHLALNVIRDFILDEKPHINFYSDVFE